MCVCVSVCVIERERVRTYVNTHTHTHHLVLMQPYICIHEKNKKTDTIKKLVHGQRKKENLTNLAVCVCVCVCVCSVPLHQHTAETVCCCRTGGEGGEGDNTH